MEYCEALESLALKFKLMAGKGNLHIFSLITKKSLSEKVYLRFFICGRDNFIEDITRQVAVINNIPIKDCYTYFAIFTHISNREDFVENVSLELFKNRYKIDHNIL